MKALPPEEKARRIRERDRKRRGRGRVRNKKYVADYKAAHTCIDCPETDPVCLDFDHRPGTEKKFLISKWCNDGKNIVRLIDEIDKCDVRCSNCHRKRHARDGGTKYGPDGKQD